MAAPVPAIAVPEAVIASPVVVIAAPVVVNAAQVAATETQLCPYEAQYIYRGPPFRTHLVSFYDMRSVYFHPDPPRVHFYIDLRPEAGYI